MSVPARTNAASPLPRDTLNNTPDALSLRTDVSEDVVPLRTLTAVNNKARSCFLDLSLSLSLAYATLGLRFSIQFKAATRSCASDQNVDSVSVPPTNTLLCPWDSSASMHRHVWTSVRRRSDVFTATFT